MAFKESQLPKDAINSKEIDSIYKFLVHVSHKKIEQIMIFLLSDRLDRAVPARRSRIPHLDLHLGLDYKETGQFSRDTLRHIP